MTEINNYDNYLTRFKNELWDNCISNNIFNNIPESSLGKVKEIFENNVSNYNTQIMQNENSKQMMMLLINKINTDVSTLKSMQTIMTKEERQQTSRENFDKALEEKQSEFNSLLKKNVPEQPVFSDNKEDEPINNDKLEELINQQMKEREQIMKINKPPPNSQQLSDLEQNKEENKIVSNNQYSSINNQTLENSQSFSIQDNTSTQQLNLIINKINNIEKNIEKLSNILQKVVNSQIALLKK